MDVILLEKIGKLGELGDKVTVKAGYGRNYLIPKGKAVSATRDNLEQFEARRSELETAAAEATAVAEVRAGRLQELGQLTITANAGEEGKLFGSIGTRDIAEAICAAGVEITKAEIRMPEGALRELGEFEVAVHLHADVDSTVSIAVIDEA
jgi:large subunit ribosomal protein L9